MNIWYWTTGMEGASIAGDVEMGKVSSVIWLTLGKLSVACRPRWLTQQQKYLSVVLMIMRIPGLLAISSEPSHQRSRLRSEKSPQQHEKKADFRL